MSKKLLDRFIASTVAVGSRAALDGYDYDAWKHLDIVEKGGALDAVMDKLRRRVNDPRAVHLLMRYTPTGAVRGLQGVSGDVQRLRTGGARRAVSLLRDGTTARESAAARLG